MNVGLLGKKIGMTQVFDEKGKAIPVTIIKLGPCTITQIKSIETCGYNAIQIGYLELSSNSKKLTKRVLGHFSKNNLPAFRHLKEYRVSPVSNLELSIGKKIDISIFDNEKTVDITGITIGKGNAGNIKKHNFNRGAMTHGSKHHRLQGSMGAGTSPGRVFPGKRMPGRLGGKKQTIKNLSIFSIDTNENLLIVKGSIPGKSGKLISVKKSKLSLS